MTPISRVKLKTRGESLTLYTKRVGSKGNCSDDWDTNWDESVVFYECLLDIVLRDVKSYQILYLMKKKVKPDLH